MRLLAVMSAAALLLGAPAAADQDLWASADAAVQRAMGRAGLRAGQVGFLFLDEEGREVWAMNGGRPFIVASNNKLVTTAAALEVLGPEFQWSTTLYLRGSIEGETLQGDLWVRGTGDPNISGRHNGGDALFLFKLWADALKERGIRRVAGDLLLDDFAFDRQHVHPSWPERYRAAWFGAEISALSLADNCVELVLTAPRPHQQKVGFSVYPPTSYVTVVNQCLSRGGRSRPTYGVKRRPDDNHIDLTGTLQAGTTSDPVWVPVHEPSVFFGTVMRETLEAEGIVVDGAIRLAPVPQPPPPDLRTVHVFTSRLDDSLMVTNKRSQNLYAEIILRTLGYQKLGTGSFEAGLRVVRDYLHHCVGIDPTTFQQADGSGLSRGNRFTPRQLARLLRVVAATPDGGLFRSTLPRSGIDGTLKKRMDDNELAGRVYAKTGYIRGVSALSGYLRTASERLIPFSILINAEDVPKYRMARVEEAILEAAYQRLE